jgi:hypothetical protein
LKTSDRERYCYTFIKAWGERYRRRANNKYFRTSNFKQLDAVKKPYMSPREREAAAAEAAAERRNALPILKSKSGESP